MNSPLGRLKDCDPPTYQDRLADLIRTIRPNIVVETGLCLGFGAEYILRALDDCGKGHLYSIDPMDFNHLSNGCIPRPDEYDANPIIHPRFTLIRKLSQDALEPLFDEVGPFDVFIHDSDHSAECQSFEYEAAWRMVRPGGIIVSDDIAWGNPPHQTWDKFLAWHNLKATIIGNAQFAVHP